MHDTTTCVWHRQHQAKGALQPWHDGLSRSLNPDLAVSTRHATSQCQPSQLTCSDGLSIACPFSLKFSSLFSLWSITGQYSLPMWFRRWSGSITFHSPACLAAQAGTMETKIDSPFLGRRHTLPYGGPHSSAVSMVRNNRCVGGVAFADLVLSRCQRSKLCSCSHWISGVGSFFSEAIQEFFGFD